MRTFAKFENERQYFTIPSEIVTTTLLDPIEKCLYLFLYKLADEKKDLPSTGELMNLLHIKSRNTLKKYIDKLVEKNLLVVQENFNSIGMRTSNTYIVKNLNLAIGSSEQIRIIVETLAKISPFTLTSEEYKIIATKAYEIHAENAVKELVSKFYSLDVLNDESVLEGVLNALENDCKITEFEQSAVELQFVDTFKEPSLQDKATFKRLISKYPEGVVHYALESVKGKDAQQNWAYITATIKRLSETCVTYDDCVEHKKAYFAQQDALKQEKKKEQLKKQKLVTRLIAMGTFGDVQNIAAYTKKVLADETYKNLDACELFDLLTGQNHLWAMEYDQQIFDILYA